MNYSLEILYFAWLLYSNVTDENLREALIKSNLVRCFTVNNLYKIIDILFEYWNTVYIFNIKNNKNSTYNI